MRVTPAPPMGLAAVPMVSTSASTCWTPATPRLLSKVTFEMLTPAPTVSPNTELFEKPVMFMLATAPPLISTAVPFDSMFVLLLKFRFSVPATRLMSTALPACVLAVFQLFVLIVSARVPVVPALRLTSMPSAPALEITLLPIVSVARAGQRAGGRDVDRVERRPDRCSPTISAGIAVGERRRRCRRRR